MEIGHRASHEGATKSYAVPPHMISGLAPFWYFYTGVAVRVVDLNFALDSCEALSRNFFKLNHQTMKAAYDKHGTLFILTLIVCVAVIADLAWVGLGTVLNRSLDCTLRSNFTLSFGLVLQPLWVSIAFSAWLKDEMTVCKYANAGWAIRAVLSCFGSLLATFRALEQIKTRQDQLLSERSLQGSSEPSPSKTL